MQEEGRPKTKHAEWLVRIWMELPFTRPHAPKHSVPKLKSKQSAWEMMKPDRHGTLEGAPAWPWGIIYYWCLLTPPHQSLWFIHNIWASSLTGKHESLSAEWGNGNSKGCRKIVNRHSDIAKCHVFFPRNIQDANKNHITLLFGKGMGRICFLFSFLLVWTRSGLQRIGKTLSNLLTLLR